MATISEAEILKAAAEASLMSTSTFDGLAVKQVLSGTTTSVSSGEQSEAGGHMNVNENVIASTSQTFDDTDFANVPTVSENAVIRSSFEVGGKTYDNVEALLAAHLVGMDDNSTSTPLKGVNSSTDFEDAYREVGEEVTYKILRGATKRGNDKLVDSLGFSYTLKNTKNMTGVVYWWCTVRNKNCKCPAIVKQLGGTFTRGKWKHEHLVGLNKSSNFSPVRTKKKEILEKKKQRKKLKEENRVPDYIIIKEGSKAGMDLLKDKFGYTYTMRKANKNADKRNWICSIRNQHLRCPASVVQLDDIFRASEVPHKHLPGEKMEKPPEVVAAYSEAFLRNSQGTEDYSDSDDEDYYDEDDDDDDEDDDFDYGDTATGTVVRTSKNRKQGRKEHPTFLGPTCTINLTKCESMGCNCKLVHCPFCDKDHFKPAKPARVQDHLEMSHFAHGVQFDDYMIVKCFKDCGQKKFGHYHCVFCKEQIIKRNAYGRHLSRHMKKKGIPSNLLILPDSKYPDTINAYGYEIPICKKDCKMSEGKHFHCPKCNRVCRERSVTVNHVWRCLQAEKIPPEDDAVDVEDAEQYDLEESLLKEHFSIVKNFKDLSMNRCEEPNCCRNMYHCQLCPPKLYRPTYKQQLIVHYISHWKTRVPYKSCHVLRCFHACLDPRLPPIKTRYHYHCPLCAKILRQRNTFQDHLSYCHYFNTGESMTIEGVNDHAEDIAKITQELGPLIDSVDYMEDKLTMEAKLNQAIKDSAAIGRKTRKSSRIKKDLDDEADESMDEDDSEAGETSDDEGDKRTPLMSTPAIHTEFLKHLTSQTSGLTFKDITAELEGAAGGKGDSKKLAKGDGLDISMIFESSSAVLSEKLIKSFKKESSLKACLSIVTKRTDTNLICSETGDKKTYMLTGKLENLSFAQELIAQLVLPTEKAGVVSSSYSKQSQMLKDRALSIKKEIQESSDEDQTAFEIDDKPAVRKKAESYKEKMARVRREKEAAKKKTVAGKSKAQEQDKQKSKSKSRKDTSGTDDMNDSFPYSEIKEIIAASKIADQKGSAKKTKTNKGTKKDVETPARYSSRGRPPAQKQDTPTDSKRNSKGLTGSPRKTPKVTVKKKTPNKSSVTPGRYSTRGARVDYQKMNAGIYIKQEVISDEEEVSDATDSDSSAEKIAENVDESENLVKRKRSKPSQGEMKSKRATVMYKPVTDSEISESEQDEQDDKKIVDESISDDADDYISDLDDDRIEVNDKSKKKSDSASYSIVSEDQDNMDSEDQDAVVEEATEKVTVQVISRSSPVKIGSAAATLKKLPDIIAKRVIPVSPRKIIDESSNKETQCDKETESKVVASVPLINNKGARKVSIIARKRPAQDSSVKGSMKRLKLNESGEILEINENIDNEVKPGPNHSMLAKDKLKCSLCNFEAEAFSELTKHLEEYHNIVNPPRCDVCELDFASVKQVQIHLDKKHGPLEEAKKYKCGACESIFSSQKLCESHIRRVHLISISEGGQSRKDTRYSCEKCEFETTAAQDFYDHMKIKHDEDIVCETCGKTFSNVANLKLHKESVHLKNKMAACHVCGKEFNHIRYLKAHMESHSDVPKFTCAQCKRGFSSKAALVSHIETHKPPDEREYKFMCSYCGKRYLLKANYEDHLNKHTGAKPYKCKICNRSFGFRSMLIKHNIYIHSQERPYSCTQCKRSFKFKRLLDNHMTTHTQKSSHVCSKCFKSFTTRSSLKVHEQKCTGILSRQVPAVGKTSTLILHIDGKPSLYQLGVSSEQFVSAGTGAGVDTIISIPDQPAMQEQILTDILPEQTQQILPPQTTQVLAPPLITEPSPDGTSLLPAPQVSLETIEAITEQTLLTAPEQVQVPADQSEVYACSECNSMFGSLAEAETHILTVHSQQVVA